MSQTPPHDVTSTPQPDDAAPPVVAEIPEPQVVTTIIKTRTPGRLRRRVYFGGIAAAIVAVAMFLQDLGLFNGFGFGPGDGGGPGTGQQTSKKSDKSQKTPKPAVKSNRVVTPKKKIPAKQLVEVWLDHDKFYDRRPDGSDSPRELSIDEIISAVQKSTLKSKGPRLAVQMFDTANLSTRDALERALIAAGIGRNDFILIEADR